MLSVSTYSSRSKRQHDMKASGQKRHGFVYLEKTDMVNLF